MQQTDNKQMWDRVLGDIEISISRANFSTWFKDTYIARQENGVVFLGVPSDFVKEWLSNKYHKSILRSLRGLNEQVRNIEYIVGKDEETKDLRRKKGGKSEYTLQNYRLRTYI